MAIIALKKPLIALVGRPNVGKSTLFNSLTRTRDALVANQSGLTRDRHYGEGKMGCPGAYWVVDMGGIGESGLDSANLALQQQIAAQAYRAMQEADGLFFVVDGRQGLCAGDFAIADGIRPLNKPVWVLVNKTDGLDEVVACAEFSRLGFAAISPISAVHGYPLPELMLEVCQAWQIAVSEESSESSESSEKLPEKAESIRVCIVGRPNVGKSTLVNRLLGEERVLTADEPGTTRDSIEIPWVYQGQAYTLVDTAGIRRQGKISEAIEKFSVIKSLAAIQGSHVVILVVDAQAGIHEQDAHLLGKVIESGRALVIALNKGENLSHEQRRHTVATLERRFAFVDFARIHWISALRGIGIKALMRSVSSAYQMAMRHFSTHELTAILQQAVQSYAPPQAQGRAIRLRYAHQGGHNPPLLIIHGNRTEHLPDSYKRYLINTYREALQLHATPLRMVFKTGDNPFAGIKNPLTERQQKKRQRQREYLKGLKK